MKVVLVANTPAPYRLPALRLLASMPNIELAIIYCSTSEDKVLNSAEVGITKYFLSKPYYAYERRFTHSDFWVVELLNKLKPDVVITLGYIPTFLYAFFWTWWTRVPHVPMTDGTLLSESGYSWAHRLIRRIVFYKSASYIGASNGSLELFKSYGISKDKVFKAPLAVNNKAFRYKATTENKVDFIFCGRLIKHKGPMFALQVGLEVSKKLDRKVSIDFVGKGDEEVNLREYAEKIKENVVVRFQGYASQEALPAYYKGAKVFLFPSEWDPWGVVANEACAAGLPIIVSPHAGVAGELAIDGQNAFVRELNVEQWADAAVDLLTNPDLLNRMGQRSFEMIQEFSFEAAASGMYAAVLKAAESDKR